MNEFEIKKHEKRTGGEGTGVCIGQNCTLGELDWANLHWSKDRRPMKS